MGTERLIRVEITDEPIIPGGEYQGKQRPPKQLAYLHQGDRYPTKFTVSVDSRDGPLRPGWYLLGGAVFTPGQFGLEFRGSKLSLVSVDEALAHLGGSKLKAA